MLNKLRSILKSYGFILLFSVRILGSFFSVQILNLVLKIFGGL